MRQNSKKIGLIAVLLFCVQLLFAQTTITGKVIDSSQQGLPGVSVVVKGTTTGTVTQIDGTFTLSVPESTGTLVFSFIGMKTTEELINGRTTINVTLEEETIGVDEVVVVGYGTQKKANLTGAVSAVDCCKGKCRGCKSVILATSQVTTIRKFVFGEWGL